MHVHVHVHVLTRYAYVVGRSVHRLCYLFILGYANGRVWSGDEHMLLLDRVCLLSQDDLLQVPLLAEGREEVREGEGKVVCEQASKDRREGRERESMCRCVCVCVCVCSTHERGEGIQEERERESLHRTGHPSC